MRSQDTQAAITKPTAREDIEFFWGEDGRTVLGVLDGMAADSAIEFVRSLLPVCEERLRQRIEDLTSALNGGRNA